MKDLSVKDKNFNFQKEIRISLPPQVQGEFLKHTQRHKFQIKILINLTILKLKHLSIEKVKKRTIILDIFNTYNKGLVSRIYKECPQTTQKQKANNPIEKWEKDRSRHVTEEKIKKDHKHMKRYPTLFVLFIPS